jgi:hypothetical protein
MTRRSMVTLMTAPLILTGASPIAESIAESPMPNQSGVKVTEVAPSPRVYTRGYAIAGGAVIEVARDSITLQGFWGLKGKTLNSMRTADHKATVCFGSFTFHDKDRTINALKTITTRDTLTLVSADGEKTVLKLKDQPHRRFWAHHALADGEYLRSWGRMPILDQFTYRLSDVRVGDLVNLYIHREDGYEICDAISIVRRPGGRVPPAHGESPDTKVRHHERMNADQNLEDKGIPLAERFHTGLPEKTVAPIPPAKP